MNYFDVSIELDQLAPKLFRAFFFDDKEYPPNHKFLTRYICDYEMEIYLTGGGNVTVDKRNYKIQAGDVHIRRPGQLVGSQLPFSGYAFVINMSGSSRRIIQPNSFDAGQQHVQPNFRNPYLDLIPPITRPKDKMKYSALAKKILEAYERESPIDEFLVIGLLIQLFYELIADNTHIIKPKSRKVKYSIDFLKEAELLKQKLTNILRHQGAFSKVITYVNLNFASKITLESMAKIMDLSPTYFHRIFTQRLHITPNNYVTMVRLSNAQTDLLETELSIRQIAIKCGYDNVPYFSSVFKKQLHISPGEFRKKAKMNDKG